MISSLDSEARKRANLRVLQRLDPWTTDIVGDATHVVLYEFSEHEQQWEKLNVEGSLFVTKRGDEPHFKLFVLNRNSTQNLEVGVTSTFQMQLREPYLIFRDGDGDKGATAIRGLWFHDGDERIRVSRLLEQVVQTQSSSGTSGSSSNSQTAGSLPRGDQNRSSSHPHSSDGKQLGSDNISSGNSLNTSTIATARNNDVDVESAAAALLSPLSLVGIGNVNSPPPNNINELVQPSHNGNIKHPAAAAVRQPPSARQDSSSFQQNLVLDKKSLQLSLLSLIQDERFLDLIHAQYLKVAHARANRDKNDSAGNQHNH